MANKYHLVSTFRPGDGLLVPSQSPSISGIQYYPNGLYGNPLTSESDLYGSSAPYYPSGHHANFYVPGSHQASPPLREGPLPSDQRSAPLVENFTETPIDFSGSDGPGGHVKVVSHSDNPAKTYTWIQPAVLLFFLAGGYYFIYKSVETKMGPQPAKVWLGVGVGLTAVALTGKLIADRDL